MILGLIGLYATGVVVTAGIEVVALALCPEDVRTCRKIDVVEAVCVTSVAWPKFWYEHAKHNRSKNEEKNENDAM